jgi:hypothetical protein
MVAHAEFYPGTYQQGTKKCRSHIVHGNGFGNSVGLPAYEPICSRLPKILRGASFRDNEATLLATLCHQLIFSDPYVPTISLYSGLCRQGLPYPSHCF